MRGTILYCYCCYDDVYCTILCNSVGGMVWWSVYDVCMVPYIPYIPCVVKALESPRSAGLVQAALVLFSCFLVDVSERRRKEKGERL